MEAEATFAVRGHRTHWHDAPPIVLRPTAPGRLHLLHAAGGPLGGDKLRLTGTVGTESALRVDSAGATVVQPDPHHRRATWTVLLDIAAGATLRWTPQPTVICADADYHATLCATLADDSTLHLRELLVLGRSNEQGGRCATRLSITVGDEPLLDHETVLDGTDPVLSGPAGSGGHRIHGMALLAGREACEVKEQAGQTGNVQWAVLPLAGPGWLALAVGPSATAVTCTLDHLLRDQAHISFR
jgi:urease accessory protein